MRFVVTAWVLILVGCIDLGAESRQRAPRVVWNGPEVTLLGAPSRDGRYLSYVDRSGDLAVREIATGVSRSLTRKAASSKEFAYFSVISRDSRRIAFAWFNDEGFYDLRVIDLDGSNVRVLYRNEEAGFVQPCAWSPDGKHILTLFFRSDNISQIAMVPVDGGPPKTLRSLNWVYPKRMDLSPDGRFIVYDSFADSAWGERTIYALSTSGDQETRLVSLPGSHLFPLWTPDGKDVVFASERGGQTGVWAVSVVDGKAVGAPRQVRDGLGRILPMSIAENGDYFYGLRSGETDVFVTTLMNPAAKPLRASIRFPGRNNAPAWSPDGKLLAFLSRSGTENFGEASRVITVRSLESDDERQLTPKLAHIERVRWAPDAQSLLVSGSDGKGRAGLFRVDAKTSEMHAIGWRAGGGFRGFPGVWSSKGDTVYYIYDESEVREHAVDTGKERAIGRGEALLHLAISPDDRFLAVGSEKAIRLIPLAGGESRIIPFEALAELEWGPSSLFAARDRDLWRIPTDGNPPERFDMPGNRSPGFSLHPDGKRIALTAGSSRSEVWTFRLRGIPE